MAGVHQLWTFDPFTGITEVAAGTTNEGLLDGRRTRPGSRRRRGLAVDGDRLWLADSETSALRWIGTTEVHTAVGTGLFDFGLRDGKAERGAAAAPARRRPSCPTVRSPIADTYNGAVRRYDPRPAWSSTMATGLAEPSGLLSRATTSLVVESAAHRLTRIPLGRVGDRRRVQPPTQRPPTEVAAGEVTLDVRVHAAAGAEARRPLRPVHPAARVVDTGRRCSGTARATRTDLTRRLVIDERVGDGRAARRGPGCVLR